MGGDRPLQWFQLNAPWAEVQQWTMIVCNTVSILACARMLVYFARLPRNLRCRTTPRSMWLLGMSDILLHCALVVGNILGERSPYSLKSILDWCLLAARCFSAWMELAICASFLLRSFRKAHCMRAWLPLGACICTAIAIFVEFAIGQTDGPIPPSERTKRFSLEAIVVAGFCMMITSLLSCLCLIVAVCRLKNCGDVIVMRSLHQAMAFAANVILTEAPFCVWVALNLHAINAQRAQDMEQLVPHPVFFLFADLCYSLSGSLNSATIFWQSRYASQSIDQIARSSTIIHSFHVRWESTDDPKA